MEEKYLKYKLKYLNLKKQQQMGGSPNEYADEYYEYLNKDSISVSAFEFMKTL